MVFVVREAITPDVFLFYSALSSCIICNTRSKYNVSASDVIVLRSMRPGGSGVWGGTHQLNHTQWRLKQRNRMDGVDAEKRSWTQREGLSTCCLRTMTQNEGVSVWKSTAVMCGSRGLSLQSRFSLLFPPREPYSSKASAWKASHSLQCSPNLEKSNENVKRCPSGTGKNLPLAAPSSSTLWRSVCTHAVCGCVLLLGLTHMSESFFSLLFWDLTSSTKPQNRLFFSGRDVRV